MVLYELPCVCIHIPFCWNEDIPINDFTIVMLRNFCKIQYTSVFVLCFKDIYRSKTYLAHKTRNFHLLNDFSNYIYLHSYNLWGWWQLRYELVYSVNPELINDKVILHFYVDSAVLLVYILRILLAPYLSFKIMKSVTWAVCHISPLWAMSFWLIFMSPFLHKT